MTVKVTCYNSTKEFPSMAKAIREVKSWVYCSEGAEQSRYVTCLMQLLDGKTNVSDGE